MELHKKRIAQVMAVAVLAAAVLFTGFGYKPGCRITQYADVTGKQAMFYTIEPEDGGLIVVDGGNAGNEDYVRSVIREKGGHVD